MDEQWLIPSAAVQLTYGTVLLRAHFQDDVLDLHAAVMESITELQPYLDFARDNCSAEQTEQWVTACPANWLADARRGRLLSHPR